MARGSLRIYLGAAPGVGKTYAMLDEGRRRAERGADVVIGALDTHGRRHTEEQAAGLETMPSLGGGRDRRHHRAADIDVGALVVRAPEVVLVDDFQHVNSPGALHLYRWQDVDDLLAAGIDVVSTLNIEHLESLADVVARITGTTARESVPDAVVRQAAEIELVDMSPEALRRRMAHGNVFPAERIDAALANYFRPGTLGALRELALLWLADRVDVSLADYRNDHGIADTWDIRERVVVGLTGAPGNDRLIRRAARMAGRVGGDFIGVHVVLAGTTAATTAPLDAQRQLVQSLGGTVHEVVGHSAADALVSFARSEKATQIVVGTPSRRRRFEHRHESFVAALHRLAAGIDIHVIASDGIDDRQPSPARARPPIERRRTIAAWLLALIGIPVLTIGAIGLRGDVDLSTFLLVFLSLVVVVSALGGRLVAGVAAVVSSLFANFFLVQPHHTLSIADPENIVALAVFVAVAITVGSLVDVAARRGLEARLARTEAEVLARAAAELAVDPDPVPALVDHVRAMFALDGVVLTEIDIGAAHPLAESGRLDGPPTTVLRLREGMSGAPGFELRGYGRTLSPDDQRVLRVLGDQLAIALDKQRLTKGAADASALADVDAVRTALLRAVSHDLRTPLASIKAMVSGLRDDDVEWTPAQLAEGLATIDSETDRLNRLVVNLLDASRLQVGAVAVHRRPTDIGDTILSAVESVGPSGATVVFDLPHDLPAADTDPTLLERAVANLVANAVRYSPAPGSVRVTAEQFASAIHVRIIDRGPGIPRDQYPQVVAPFQRRGDGPTSDGAGLGMSIAQGFTEALGGTMTLDDTPGGGLTVMLSLPVADVPTVVSDHDDEPSAPVDLDRPGAPMASNAPLS